MLAAVKAVAATLLLLAACGGSDEHLPDARVGLDATVDVAVVVDAPPGPTCTGGGAATVDVDHGGAAEPVRYRWAWFNRGHLTKSCFEIDVVLSTRDTIEGSYLADPELLEIQFLSEPVLGANDVQLRLHTPDTFLTGTATLTALGDGEVTGSVHATSGVLAITGALAITGDFTAPRCAGIFDPCL